jgi:hypothetical protein
MKSRFVSGKLLLSTLLLTLAPAAMARTTWYADGVNGNDNNNCKTPQTACKTIGHAISLASSGDSVRVSPAIYTENLTISINLNLIGSGASTTIIDGGALTTVVTVQSSAASVSLSKFTIRNGKSSAGGGISNQGTLTLNYSTVSGNNAGGVGRFDFCGGGGIVNQGGRLTINTSAINNNHALIGAGICNAGTLTINRTTLSGNTASPVIYCEPAGVGGGIQNVSGALVINNSTLTGNTAFSSFGDVCNHPAYGGGISYRGGGVTINNTTISNNSVQGEWGGFGGGISGAVTLQNSIVADTAQGGNCYGTMNSNGYNLSSDDTCNFKGTGDLNNTNPVLGTLGDYGGPTQTIPLLSESPAIDAGNPSGCNDGNGHLLRTDQRGKPRPDREEKAGCDMGAFERQSD